MKKILSVLLAMLVILLTGTMIACSSNDNTQDDNDSTITTTVDWKAKIRQEIIETLSLNAMIAVSGISPSSHGYVNDAWLNKIYSESGTSDEYCVTGRFCVSTTYGYIYYNTFEVTASYDFDTDTAEVLTREWVNKWAYVLE